MKKKIYIIDLEQNHPEILLKDCSVIFINSGEISLKKTKIIKLENINKKYKSKKIFTNFIRKKFYEKKDFFHKEMEICNLRNDKNLGISKIINFIGIKEFLLKNKEYSLHLISDNQDTIQLVKNFSKKNIKNEFNKKIINKKTFKNFYISYLKFFFKSFFILLILKIFKQNHLKKKLIFEKKEWCLSLFPNFYKSSKENFFGSNYNKLNFLISDETHLNHSMTKILQIYFANKNKIINIESFLEFKDLINYFKKIFSTKKILKKSLDKSCVINGIDFSTYLHDLIVNSFLNRSKLSIYDKAIEKFIEFYKINFFHIYLFEYNFGFYLTRLFKQKGKNIIGYQHGIFGKNLLWVDLITSQNDKIYYPNILVSNNPSSLKEYKKKFKYKNIKFLLKKRKISELSKQIKIKSSKKNKDTLIISGTHDIKDIHSYCKKKVKNPKNEIFFIKTHPKNKFFFKDESNIKLINNIDKKIFNKVLISSTSTLIYDLDQLKKKYSIFKTDYKTF